MRGAAQAILAADLRGPRGVRPPLRWRAAGDLPGVPAVHRLDREGREIPGRRPARGGLGRDHGAHAAGEADGDRRTVRRDEGAPRRLLPGRGEGPRRGDRYRGAHPVGAVRERGGPAREEDRALAGSDRGTRRRRGVLEKTPLMTAEEIGDLYRDAPPPLLATL